MITPRYATPQYFEFSLDEAEKEDTENFKISISTKSPHTSSFVRLLKTQQAIF